MPMKKKSQREALRRKTAMPYLTSEMAAIIEYVGRDINDPELMDSLHFSPTALTMVRRVMMGEGTIVTDTALALNDIDNDAAAKLGVTLQCFIDHPQVLHMAEQRRVTRAEVALDHALSLPGLKLIAVGSAPMALNRLLQRAEERPLNDIVVLAAPTGFASVIQMKERIWASGLAAIVVRGKKGGSAVTSTILNALLAESLKQQKK